MSQTILDFPGSLFLPREKTTSNFFLISGPCVVEDEKIVLCTAERIREICERLRIPLIFKSSYRKANRSRADSFTGIGDIPALKILRKVHDTFDIPVITDIHSAEEASIAAEYVDMLQIPSFLCRQTEILVAAAKTGKPVNVKKGQFLSAESMQFVVEKIRNSGSSNTLLTERGTMFGYNDLIVDYRSIPVMQAMKVPVVLDCTHSVQQPNQMNGITGGRPELIETMARAGIAVGVDGLFIETHPYPSQTKCDGTNMLHLDRLEPMLKKMTDLRTVMNSWAAGS